MTEEKVTVGIFLVLSTILGSPLVYAKAGYAFSYDFDHITLGTHSGDIVSVLGRPKGKVQNLVIIPSQDTRDSYTNTVTYQAESHLFWRRTFATYYVGFAADDTATMMIVRYKNGDTICQVKGIERSIFKDYNHT